jgi:hypothetical protein
MSQTPASSGIDAAEAVPPESPSEPLDLKGEATESALSRLLGRLPYLLSSRPVIMFGILLFFYLFVYAGLATLFGHPDAVSANTQLILGNYTNVSSSVGAGIAAGASLTLLRHRRHSRNVARAALDAARDARSYAQETHRLMHTVHSEQAGKLGQTPGQLKGE